MTSTIFNISLLLLLTVAAVAFGQLSCYDCDPITDGREVCLKNKNTRTAPCEAKPNRTSLCMSAYMKHNTNSTRSGVYRGCLHKPQAVVNACEWLKETTQNFTYVSCVPCNTTRCNTIILYEDGTSGSPTIFNTFFPILFSFVFIISGVFQ